MKATREKINNVTLINQIWHDHTCNLNRQEGMLPKYAECVEFDWSRMIKDSYYGTEVGAYIEVGIHTYTGRYYMICFDYIRHHNPMEYVNISNSTITTDFSESFSLN